MSDEDEAIGSTPAQIHRRRRVASFWVGASNIVRVRVGDLRQLSREYRTVVELDSRIDHTVYVSQQPENVPMNRYTNVLPYDYNLVTCGRDSSSSGYLNASSVYSEDRASGMEFKYICSQVCARLLGDVCCGCLHHQIFGKLLASTVRAGGSILALQIC